MQITRVNFKTRQTVMGVGSAKSQLSPGEACDTAWGGGTIQSMEYDAQTGSLAIRKNGRFERVNQGERATLKSFDVALVPWINVDSACAVEDAVEAPKVEPKIEPAKEELPPAKPIQQGGQQRR